MILFQTYRLDAEMLIDNGGVYAESLETVKERYDNSIVVVDTSTIPADFSTQTYTIVDGSLVPASPEIVAERRAIQTIANHEATRIARQQRYDSEAVTSLYWNWQESGAKADKIKWLAAKEAIRQELPYAEQTEQHENHLKLNNL